MLAPQLLQLSLLHLLLFRHMLLKFGLFRRILTPSLHKAFKSAFVTK